MKKNTGVWIDHSKAILVSVIDDQVVSWLCIESGSEDLCRLSGGARSSTPWGPQDVAPEGKAQRRRIRHLSVFYRQVIRKIRDADKILIFGPGSAKYELVDKIAEVKGLYSKVIGIERTNKMTQNQIITKVRDLYAGRHCLAAIPDRRTQKMHIKHMN
ncbi:hypothetical protein ACFLS1_07220 [Verrucomicrobiota bacterium]